MHLCARECLASSTASPSLGPERAEAVTRCAMPGSRSWARVWGEQVGRAENPVFFHTQTYETPFVALKLAMSLDGRIASAPGERTRISGLESEREVHRLRTGFDAVLVGNGTVRVDNPRLTVRMVPPGRTPVRRLILDAHAKLPTNAALFADVADTPVTRVHAPRPRRRRHRAAGMRWRAGSPCPARRERGSTWERC